MNNIRRINIFGGPGCGKSTFATMLFTTLKNHLIEKKNNLKVELVQEYVKEWAYEGRKPIGFDQFHICSQQLRKEEILLRNGVDLIVTDSPLLMQCFYAMKNELPYYEYLVNIAQEFEKQYPSINFYLDRGGLYYEQFGRFENLDDAKYMDKYIKECLYIYQRNFQNINHNDNQKVVDQILKNINK